VLEMTACKLRIIGSTSEGTSSSVENE
jgi:hypothetical protein